MVSEKMKANSERMKLDSWILRKEVCVFMNL